MLLLLLLACRAVAVIIPVVYISFGDIKTFLQLNIELASRNNPVYILHDLNKPVSMASTTMLYLCP